MIHRVSNPYIIPFERYKMRNWEKLKGRRCDGTYLKKRRIRTSSMGRPKRINAVHLGLLDKKANPAR
jgi:hypothetical protein